MRKADRLFQTIQVLRRSSRPVTGADLARELEVSLRTVYRDVAVLIAQGVPLQGEPGFGYVLDDNFDMPPLMLTADEIEAAVLGAQWVAGQGDPTLAAAARDLIAKISTAVPEGLRTYVAMPTIAAPGRPMPQDGIDLTRVRAWIRQGRKIELVYRDENGAATQRVAWPVIVGFFDNARMLAAWCELRKDFRHFRADRIESAEFLDELHGVRPGELRQRWKRAMTKRHGTSPAV